MAVDRVFVRGVHVDASIGVLPWERQSPQPIEVDVDAELETDELIRTGDLSSGVDFSSIIEIVRSVATAGHTDLVESLAHAIATKLLTKTRSLVVRVEVRKYRACASEAHHVGVEVRRSRDDL